MQTILLVSTRPGAGKTAVAAGLAALLRKDGQSVGYVKAIEPGDGPLSESRDAKFMAGQVGDESGQAAARLGHQSVATILQTGGSARNAVLDAAKSAGEGKDVLLVEGPGSLLQGTALGIAPAELANALDARVIVVAKYSGDDVVDELAAATSLLGDRLLGAIVNGVPKQRLEGAADRLGGFLGPRGVKLLGVVPFDSALEAVTVADIAKHLGGQIMNSEDQAGELVEAIMVGTVVLGKASDYFRRRAKKAVIAHGSRPDMHLAALETDTRCIVLAGNVVPNPIVVARAEEEQVPLIMVRQDTLAVLEQVEELFTGRAFSEPAKVEAIAAALAKHVDLTGIRPAAAVAA